MSETDRVPLPLEDLVWAIIAGILSGAAVAAGVIWSAASLAGLQPGAAVGTFFPEPWPFRSWWGHYSPVPIILYFIFWGGSAAGAAVCVWVVYLLTRRPAGVQHVEGRQVLTGRGAVRQAIRDLAREFSWGGRGLPIISTPADDEIRISEDRETRHILTVGSVGGGKTTVIRGLIDAAIQRGDRVIALDNKSDLTESLDTGFSLIAPWDSRGLAWDVARDFNNRADAQELAAALIAESRDPMWSNAARGILSAMIIRAQTEAPGKWSFGFLAETLRGGIAEIQATVKTYSPEYYPLVADAMSRTTQSIFITLLSYLRPVLDLADAWSRCETPGRVSVRDFLYGRTDSRVMVIQGSGQYSLLQKSVTQSIFSALIREITSPRFTDVRPDERRIWVFTDELPQFGKITDFGRLIEVGRSKGVRVCVGIQDLAQLEEIYGREKVKTLSSSIGTYIICRIQGADTSRWLSDAVGKRSVKIYSPAFSSTDGGPTGRTDSWPEQERYVIRPDKWSRILGADKSGVRVALHTGGDHLYICTARHLTPEQKRHRRPATVPAEWTRPGWPALINEIAGDDLDDDPSGGGQEIDSPTRRPPGHDGPEAV